MSYIKSKNTTFFILFISCLCTTIIHAKESNLQRLANKMVPNQAKNIVFERVVNETDFFELETKGKKLIIRGNNGISMARGLNHYMRYYLHSTTSWTGHNLSYTSSLPIIKEKIHVNATLPLRYYLYLQPIITQYFIDNKSEIWLLFLIAHSKR